MEMPYSIDDIPYSDTDTNHIYIQYMVNMQRDIDCIKTSGCTKENMMELLSPLIGVLSQVKKSVANLNRMEKERRKGNRAHRTRAHKHSPTKSRQLSESEISTLVHLPAALKENVIELVNNLTIGNTDLADRLIEQDCLSEDECSHIRSQSSEKDKVRQLLRKIKARGPEAIQILLDIIRNDKPELVERVHDSLKKIQEQNKQYPLCPICLMTTSVNLKDIADHLWKANIIDDEVYGEIIDFESLHIHKQFAWSFIRTSINTSDNPTHAMNILIGALEPKYRYISEHLKKMPDDNRLPSCRCCVQRRTTLQNIYGGSQTDISSLSGGFPRFRNIYKDTTDSESALSSQDLLSSSFSFKRLDYFLINNSNNDQSEQITNMPVRTEITSNVLDGNQSISTSVNDIRSRHSSGPFVPQAFQQQLQDTFQTDVDNNNDTAKDHHESAALEMSLVEYPLDCIVRQQSSTTVCPAQSTTSDISTHGPTDADRITSDHRMSISTDSGVSPVHNRMTLEFGNVNSNNQEFAGVEQTSSPFGTKLPSYQGIGTDTTNTSESYSAQTPLNKEDLKPKLRRTHRQLPKLDIEIEEDEECNYLETFRPRKSRKSHRKMFLERQKSAPSGYVLTEPRKLADLESSNIGTRVTETRKSKQSQKREYRRSRAMSLTDSDQPKPTDVPQTPNMPFNPSWGKAPQRRYTPKWDILQGRRLRLMYSRISASDSELKSDSDTAGYSDAFTW